MEISENDIILITTAAAYWATEKMDHVVFQALARLSRAMQSDEDVVIHKDDNAPVPPEVQKSMDSMDELHARTMANAKGKL